MSRLPPRPEIDWSDASAPRAVAFDDIYFSREGGLGESDAVFLAGCDLPNAWRGRDRFAICELGFGAGVNVLAVWRAWRRTRLPHAQLHISSIEAFPLEREDAARALALFPEVADLAAKLVECWPVRAYAPQRLWFADDGLSLTLHTGEAETILAGLDGAFDAWFLDGFAPARNARMWSEAVLANIARLSAPGARLATFTVAGHVRRALQAAGFAVEKKPGFGPKRERLEAKRPEAKRSEAKRSGEVSPAPDSRARAGWRKRGPKRVAVVGAGIAGASVARALVRRGVEVIVLEAGRELGAGASGNPAGLVMPRLDRDGPLGEVFLAAYIEAVRAYEALGGEAFVACGVEARAEARNAEALGDILNDPPLPPDWMSALPNGAALHARAGLVRPLKAIHAFLRGANLMCEAPVGALEPDGQAWRLAAPDGRALLKADAVVLACGAALGRFAAAKFLPILLSRGQIEWGEGPAPQHAPQHALAQSNYLAPLDGGVMFGATFDTIEGGVEAQAVQSEAGSRARNIAALAKLAPEIAASLDPAKLNSRASLRAATPDRAPIMGALPDEAAWRAKHAAAAPSFEGGLAGPAGLAGLEPGASPLLANLYVIGGLGARGLTLAPLLGECIAGEICGEPALLSKAARAAIDPERFLKRAMKRRS